MNKMGEWINRINKFFDRISSESLDVDKKKLCRVLYHLLGTDEETFCGNSKLSGEEKESLYRKAIKSLNRSL